MIKSEKIEEWIKEVENRPSSAPIILRFIANRLRDLTARNEELLAEVISLQSEKKVEDYEQRIEYLENQIEILKRQLVGLPGEKDNLGVSADPSLRRTTGTNILVYDQRGRIARIEPDRPAPSESPLVKFIGNFTETEDSVRMLAAKSSEEILLVFTSGRIASISIEKIPLVIHVAGESGADAASTVNWDSVSAPFERHAGENLACLTPISRLAMSDFFVQASRKGFLKKLRSEMASSIFQNRYIGAGIKKSPDQIFETLVCSNRDRLVLVSKEGYLMGLELNSIPVSIEEVFRLAPSDYLISCYVMPEGNSILVMTNSGKVLHLTEDRIEISGALRTKGQPIYSAKRRADGVRVIGSAPIGGQDGAVILDQQGRLMIYPVKELSGSGTLPEGVLPVAFAAITDLFQDG